MPVKTKPSLHYPPEYYESSGDLPSYASVARRYSVDGKIPSDEAFKARVQAIKDARAKKFNPNHDDQGRFSTGDGGGGAAAETGGGDGGSGKLPDAPSGPLLFHGTTQEVIDAIAEHGLRPGTGEGATAEHVGTNITIGDQAPAVYFAASPRMAARFAAMAAKTSGGTPVVVPVHLSKEQASKLTWDTVGAGDHNVRLTSTIPPEQVGKPAVGVEAINKMVKDFHNSWTQFTETSQQRTLGTESPEHTFVPQHTSAVRAIMGKASSGTPSDEQQVIFATFVVNEKGQQMDKAGARHSASDRKMIQTMHDHAVSLGADCPGMGKVDDTGGEFSKAAADNYVKVNDELGLVFGWAIVSKDKGEDYFDVQGDHIPEHSMLKASTNFMLSDRVGKEMHAGDTKGTIVFAWPLTADIAKAMGLETTRTGLMIGWKPHDTSVLDKFKSGEYSGFSIGGERHKDEEVE